MIIQTNIWVITMRSRTFFAHHLGTAVVRHQQRGVRRHLHAQPQRFCNKSFHRASVKWITDNCLSYRPRNSQCWNWHHVILSFIKFWIFHIIIFICLHLIRSSKFILRYQNTLCSQNSVAEINPRPSAQNHSDFQLKAWSTEKSALCKPFSWIWDQFVHVTKPFTLQTNKQRDPTYGDFAALQTDFKLDIRCLLVIKLFKTKPFP